MRRKQATAAVVSGQLVCPLNHSAETETCMKLNQIWQATLGTMQLQTPRQEFNTWLLDTALLELDQGRAVIGAANPFQKEVLESRYLAPVRQALGDVVGVPMQVQFVIATPRPSSHGNGNGAALPPVALPPRPSSNGNGRHHANGAVPADAPADAPSGETHPDSVPPAPPDMPYVNRLGNGVGSNDHGSGTQLSLSSAARDGMLNSRYRFESFIVGASNRMAHAACMAVAERPALNYNPLFLYGGVGLGKTHLLHAVGNFVLDQDPEVNVMYVSSEKFTNDMINSIRRHQTEEFRLRYRNIDVLLIDDIQFIAGKESTQDEFFHTFNTLHAASKQIVISSDRPPKAIMTLEERLRSRFEWGLIVDVHAPDLETRTAILRAKGEQMSIPIPHTVIDFLATKIQKNIRELEGSLNRVAAFAAMQHAPITVDLAASALAELLDESQRRRITPDLVLQTVSQFYGVDMRVLEGKSRSRNVVIPRQVAMYLLREETGSSLVEIGNLLGGRDHTTVIHGCDKIATEINNDTRLRNEVLAIKEKLYQ